MMISRSYFICYIKISNVGFDSERGSEKGIIQCFQAILIYFANTCQKRSDDDLSGGIKPKR